MHTLQRAIQCRAFRLSYKQPQRTYILRCISVSVFNTARLTRELFTIALAYLLAATARFRRVGRRNYVHGYPFSLRFVADKMLQLVKRPTVVQAPLKFAKPFIRAFTNTLQVLNSNRFAFAFGFLHNFFGNGVILNLYRRSFSPTKPFKNLFGSFCAFGLKRTTYFLSCRAKLIQVFTRKCLSIIGSSNVVDTKINAYHIVKFLLSFVRYVAGLKQIEFSFHIGQICFSLRVFQQTGMVFTCQVRNLLSAFHCPDRSDTFIKLIRDNTRVVGDSSQWPERTLSTLVKLISVGHFANTTHYDLRRKTGRSFDVVVGAVMDFVLTPNLVLPCPSRNTVTSIVGFSHGLQEQFSLFGSRLNMDFRGQFHTYNIRNFFHILKHLFNLEYLSRQSRCVFLPLVNAGGILRTFS